MFAFRCIILILSLFSFFSVYSETVNSYVANIEEVKCLVCTRVVEELQRNASKIDKRKTINVGGFRLDDEGNVQEKFVPLAQSEVFLNELIENICDKMEDYVQATFKNSGKFTVLPLLLEDGKMNPQLSEVDIIKDSDLNRSLKHYCQSILEENEDDFIEEFKKNDHIIALEFCQNNVNLCTDTLHEEL